jgi:hypothetical protein
MQRNKPIYIVAALAVAAVLAAAAMPAASQDTTSAADMAKLAKAYMPKAVFMAISAGGVSDGDMTFTVPHGAKVVPMDSKEFGMVATYNMPLQGTCNLTTGGGTISMADALPATVTVDYAGKSAIPVAGANAVVALQDIKMAGLAMGKGKYDFQAGKVTIYMPDGTATSMKLGKPIRMSLSVDQMKLTVEKNPEVARMMAEKLKPGATFPADAAPVMLNSILAAI